MLRGAPRVVVKERFLPNDEEPLEVLPRLLIDICVDLRRDHRSRRSWSNGTMAALINASQLWVVFIRPAADTRALSSTMDTLSRSD